MVDAAVALAALGEMRAGVTRYERDTRAGIDAVGQVLRQVRQRLADEVQQRARERDRAERAFRACRARRFANCDDQARHLQQASARLERAQAATARVDAAVARFEPARRRFDSSLTSIVPEALDFLAHRQRAVEHYAQRAGSPLGTVGLTGSTSSSGGPMAAPTSSAGVTTPPGFPEGYGMVSLGLIDDGDSPVTGPESFRKGHSPEDLAWAFDAFDQVVVPALERGLGADYFHGRDQRDGRQGTKSYADTHTGFLTDDNAIVLHRQANGHYTVGNGFHRLWVARRTGRATVPAQIQ